VNSNRPNLPPISEQRKAWSAALEAEISDWLGVVLPGSKRRKQI
jgi:hypothetical protein